MKEYHWLGDEAYKALQGKIKNRVSTLLYSVFSMYGQDAEIRVAISAIMVLFEVYGQIIRGKNKPVPEIPTNILNWRD